MTRDVKTLGGAVMGDLKKAAILGLKGLLKEGEKLMQEGQVSLEDYLEKKTTGLDAFILHEQSSRRLDFVSGEVFVALQDEESFVFGVDLYFTDDNKKWTKSSHVDAPKLLSLYFCKDDQERIRAETKVAYTYDKPDA
ncbi:hypothetical protein [Pseudomonas cichorii]|uniref:hypothetical protein n=1 Tax=Pseudomonas cichorii TaxID=36746 RepID=UPI001C8A82C1|nr:hypothetical protein [Pseudomonas cichorii]MBX8496859.1 hypothetical protein [Pseudomonas cichorii]